MSTTAVKPLIKTPYFLIDENKLIRNMTIIKQIKEATGAKVLLALKCFSTWNLFDLMSQYMDGTTSSSLYEVKLGHEAFPGEVHAYSVAWSEDEIKEVVGYSDKLIFNSCSQLKRFYEFAHPQMSIGLRVNPGISNSSFALCNPNSKHSKLGAKPEEAMEVSSLLNGIMFHYNSDNYDFPSFKNSLDYISKNYSKLLDKIEWVSLGGGVYFTTEGYPLEEYCNTLKAFRDTHNVQIYLEPGEASVYNSTALVTTVLDVMYNEKNIAIVNSSIVNHLLDRFIHNDRVKLDYPKAGEYEYIIAGKSCLCGEVFGTFQVDHHLEVGETVLFQDIAGYSLVNLSWFNGINMPSIVIKKVDGSHVVIKEFNYKDFKNFLS